MSNFRNAGAEILEVIERVGDPAAVANRAFLYAKDVAGVTNVFTRLSDGSIVNISAGSVVTLDGAYDGGGAGLGRTITADAGAVAINGNAADNNNVLEVTKNPAASQVGSALSVTQGANATSAAINVQNAGSAQGLFINVNGAVAAADGIRIVETAFARSGQLLDLVRDAAALGNVVNIDNDGGGNAIDINHAGGSDALNISLDGADVNGQAIQLAETAVARVTAMVSIIRDAAATGDAINIDNNGAGNAIDMNHAGASTALRINLDSPGFIGSQGISVDETPGVARIAEMMRLTRQAAAGGQVLHLINNGTGRNLDIEQNGSNDAVVIRLNTNTGSQALVITEDNAARTQNMVDITRQAAASGDVLSITNAGSGFSIDVVSGNVRFQTAQALGGGASATLGTIGGSGPAVAAQNEWIQIDSQNGVRFVPAWA